MQILSVKCPECNGGLEIESEHKQCFCKYCGTKIILDDGGITYTYRTIDEARIKEAEVDEAVRMRELALKEMMLHKELQSSKWRIILSVVIGVLSVVLIMLGVAGRDMSIGFLVAGIILWIPLIFMWAGEIEI